MLESALRESNPPRQVGSLEPLPLGQGHVLFPEAEAEGLEPTTDESPAPAFEAGSSSSRMTSVSCGGRNRTCVKTVNSRPPVPARAPPHQTTRLDRVAEPSRLAIVDRSGSNNLTQFNQIRTAGFEPAISCSRSTRPVQCERGQTFPRPDKCRLTVCRERPAGVEPALPPWQGSRLPLHHGRVVNEQIVKERVEHRVGLEPTSPHYGCGVLAAERPVLVVVEWDRRGSNPHQSG